MNEIFISLLWVAKELKCELEIFLIDLCPSPVIVSLLLISWMIKLVVIEDHTNSVRVLIHAIEVLQVEGYGCLHVLHLHMEVL